MTVQRHELAGSIRPASEEFNSLSRVPNDEVITVSIYLKPRGAMSRAIVAHDIAQGRGALRLARQAAHADDFVAISQFAAEAGLDVIETDATRRLMKLQGSVSALEQAFGTELHRVEVGGKMCRARTGALHLPVQIADRVVAVLGLDTRPIATPKIVPHRGTVEPSGFLPSDIAALYGLPDADASGQCIAIIELGGGYTDADNQAAFGAMKIPVPEIVAVGVDGATNAPNDGSGADGEVALDIQVVGGVARGARIAVYFAPNTSQGFVDAITQAVHDEDNKPSAISISWGSAEKGWSGQAIAAMSGAFSDAALLLVTVTAASGDSLATDGVTDGKAHVDYPASDPAVLGCGGTRITATDKTISAETVWKSNGGGTGGGVSALFAKPAYQAGIKVPKPSAKKGGRGVPDVAGDADPDSGYRIVAGGQTGLIGGTSAVAPLWAGIAAVMSAARGTPVGDMHTLLYATPSVLKDIVSGDNRSGAIGYKAAKGWDPCTGLGSPDGAKLKALFGTATQVPVKAAGPRTPLFKLIGLNGSPVLVAVDSIFRLRASLSNEGPPATRVDYGGDYIFTHEAIADVLARIGSGGHFIRLTVRDGAEVWLNAAAIVSVRDAVSPNGPGTEINIAGQYQHVTETVSQVEALLS
jgi:kumamolisin